MHADTFDQEFHSIQGFEALLRLIDRDGNVIGPWFLPTLAQNKLLHVIDNFVIDQLEVDLENFKKYGFKPKISFNIDPENLLTGGHRRVVKAFSQFPGQVEVEILESSYIEDFDKTMEIVTQLKSNNISCAMDDFGTGYSTIQELNELPFNELKIDRSFIMTLDEKETSNAIVQYTIDLASKLDYRLVAEGVETRQQMEKLQAMGCSNMQGFLFSRPISLDKLESFIAQTQGSNSIFPLWQSSQKQPS